MLVAGGMVVCGCFSVAAQSLLLDDATKTVESLGGAQVRLQGRSELHITGSGTPVKGCSIELNSENAWVFFHGVRPSVVAEDFLKQFRINGKSASLGGNVRVVQYGEGSVIIPHPDDYKPLEIFSARSFTGTSQKLEQYVEYDSSKLGSMNATISSFILKRGYMATVAENEDGTGHSKCYVAQDVDLEVAALPAELDNCIRFIRIFPWRWVSKKGSCDVDPTPLNAKWNYNWNLNRKSTLDWEYVAIKQQANWPGLDRDWKDLGVNHLLGYNEPNNKVEDGYKNLNPPGSVDNAVERWPDLLKTGLRLGSPAVTDGGRGWILDFMKKAKEKNYRVDFVAIHYYRSFWKKDDPEGAARQLYGFLKDIHDQTGKPIWLTEWNNGANWTDNNHDPSPRQQEEAVKAMVKMMDETPWVERYAIYSNVEDFRKVQLDGSLTGAGEIYHDQISPIGYQQPPPEPGIGPDAVFLFNGDFCDASGNGNNATPYGPPAFAKMGAGMSVVFDGEKDYLKLPSRTGNAFSSASAFSFVGWIRWEGGGNNQRIFDFSDGEGRGIYLTPRSKRGDVEFVIRDGDEEKYLGGAQLKPGTWTHVAASITRKGGKLFINGKSARETPSMTLDPSALQTTRNYIGKGQSDDIPRFKGQLFEVRFISRELDEKEVKGLAERTVLNFDDKPMKFRVSTGMSLSGSLAGRAMGGTGTLIYSKTAGPDWLTIHPDGKLEGRPGESDEGDTTFLVSVRDSVGHLDAKFMTVEVRSR